MIQTEKIIQRLKLQIAVCHEIDDDWIQITVGTAKRILQLIERRTPVEAEPEGSNRSWWYVCGECHSLIGGHDGYCRTCGREIKWEGTGIKEIKE